MHSFVSQKNASQISRNHHVDPVLTAFCCKEFPPAIGLDLRKWKEHVSEGSLTYPEEAFVALCDIITGRFRTAFFFFTYLVQTGEVKMDFSQAGDTHR